MRRKGTRFSVLVPARKLRSFCIRLNWSGRSRKDSVFKTYSIDKLTTDCLKALDLELTVKSNIPEFVIDQYLGHQFDLLGSGWVKIDPRTTYAGLHGHSYNDHSDSDSSSPIRRKALHQNRGNIEYANAISRLIDEDYQPIDWHVDFKSGYRWQKHQWYRYVPKGHLPGVDIKVPWELARMQHLPQLALVYANSESTYCGDPRLPGEFRNQVLDFTSENPPRFGVNWACAMEVAIRVSNWLVAYDVFCSAGYSFDGPFRKVFANSVYDHGLHIARNLEGSPRRRGNHYLADLAGLAFVVQHLPLCTFSKRWRRFAISELKKEVARQFFRDGSNFEGATCYHRLATEIVTFSTAILSRRHRKIGAFETEDWSLLRRPSPRKEGNQSVFPHWYWERLFLAVRCLQDITKPTGNLPQIGDNDSGRFLNLEPNFSYPTPKNAGQDQDLAGRERIVQRENTLDASASIAAGMALFGVDRHQTVHGRISQQIVHGLSDGMKYETAISSPSKVHLAKPDLSFATVRDSMNLEEEPNCIRVFPLENEANEEWSIRFYEAVGFVFRNRRSFLVVRCLIQPWKMHTAHLHNDQFSLELCIAGEDIVEDPGSYLYTPIERERDAYRSVHAHDTPWPSGVSEPARIRPNFGIEGFPAPLYVHVCNKGFRGVYESNGIAVARHIVLGREEIVVKDWGASCDEILANELPVARGYGVR